MLLEVIVQSLADARAADVGGADRLEIVRELEREGLTPSLDLVCAIASETRLPLRAMIRERDGFVLSGPRELATLQRAMAAFAELRIDGAVLGFAREGVLDADAVRSVLAVAPALPVTFHRAFDTVRDPAATISELQGLSQIDRILTSGGSGTWRGRCRRLRQYAQWAAPRLTILAGGGIDEKALRTLRQGGCVTEVHVGRWARVGGSPIGAVSAEKVRLLRDIISL